MEKISRFCEDCRDKFGIVFVIIIEFAIIIMIILDFFLDNIIILIILDFLIMNVIILDLAMVSVKIV